MRERRGEKAGERVEAECPCGTIIHPIGELGDVWLDDRDSEFCYPDSSNSVDATARHEPLEDTLVDSLELREVEA